MAKKELIFSDSLIKLRKKVDFSRSGVKFIKLIDSHYFDQLCASLREETGFEEVNRAKLLRGKREDLRKKYIEFLGRLNVANTDDSWWALDFNTKNMLITDLGQNIFFCSLISLLLAEEDCSCLIVLSQDVDLEKQLKLWARSREVKFINARVRKLTLKELTLYIPAYIFFYFLRTIYYLFMTRGKLSYEPSDREQVIILSLINYQSFDDRGTYRDIYFGQLEEILHDRGESVLVFGKILNNYGENFEAIRTCGRLNIIPIEYFLTLGDAVGCFVKTLVKWVRPVKLRGDLVFEGFDVAYLVTKQMRRDYSRRYFVNLIFLYCTRRLVENVKVKAFVYPFENRAFEKMCLIALRAGQSRPRIVGYNHTPLTPKHTHLQMSSVERDVVPLPDRIVTLGNVTKEMLISLGQVPAELLDIGCALRQNRLAKPTLKARSARLVNLFVPLTGNVEEYVGTLRFIDEALKDDAGDYNVLIRPHPILPLDDAWQRLPKPRFSFEDTSQLPLSAVLNKADVVLNTSSSVGLEATAHGLPVIYIDFGDIILADPLSSLGVFKWSISDPRELIVTLKQIADMSDEEYAQGQRQAAKYGNEYILPASPENIDHFASLVVG